MHSHSNTLDQSTLCLILIGCESRCQSVDGDRRALDRNSDQDRTGESDVAESIFVGFNVTFYEGLRAYEDALRKSSDVLPDFSYSECQVLQVTLVPVTLQEHHTTKAICQYCTYP